jgi:hypothetical protein
MPDSLKTELQVERTEKTLNLTGEPDDLSWLKAIPVELKFETSPGENTFANQRTIFASLRLCEK